MAKKKKKLRVSFRKNRSKRARSGNLTRETAEQLEEVEELVQTERLSGKGELSRYRTVIASENEEGDLSLRNIDESKCLTGRVVSAIGLNSLVKTDDGQQYECTTRRVVRTMSRDSRNAVVTGDVVIFLPLDENAGVIERVNSRHGVISRKTAGKEHIIVSNIDCVLIIASAADPPLKTPLIDRIIVSAEKGQVEPVVCINKCDLVDPASLQRVAGMYGKIGYQVVLTSTQTGLGIERLKQILHSRQSVLTGQSGVGKSSLLNVIQPDLKLQTKEISSWTSKGKHTTRRSRLISLDCGGWVADTPGIRQFGLWDVIPEEVEGFFVEFRPFVRWCKFPDCTHTHESGCGIKTAVKRDLISLIRYESYLRMLAGDDDRLL